MNKNELKKILESNNIMENHLYEINDTNIGDLYRINYESVKDKWLLYYSERGIKNQISSFVSEDEACMGLLSEISKQIKKPIIM
jgi:hypothetical protein